MYKNRLAFLIAVFILSSVIQAQEEMGNPIMNVSMNSIVKEYSRYVVSYNTKYNIPNWVAWKLTKTQLPNTDDIKIDRDDKFTVDNDLKNSNIGVFFAKHEDYPGNDYDRGHMCPAEDNRFLREAMTECFYTINICPQTANLNRGKWKVLENRCRSWVQEYDSVYIVCGPILSETEDLDESFFLASDSINKIYVPKRFFKVILKCRNTASSNKKTPPSNRDFKDANLTLATVSDQAIGYIFTMNESSTDFEIRSVSHIEAVTGINFFPKLKNSNKVEGKILREAWHGYLLEGGAY